MLSRREAMRIGGLLLAALPFSRASGEDRGVVDIAMRGNDDGSAVWFDPVGVLVRPGQTVRWTNKDPGNSHTSTAYHPDNDGHPLRIPSRARPWNSDYLLPDEAFDAVFDAPGVYDYFCIPHEHSGMVGRIVVAESGALVAAPPTGSPIEGIEADPFPPVDDILRRGHVGAPA